VVDLFASDIHHKSDQFVFSVYSPGCLAVDAPYLNWSKIVPKGQAAWIFPPIRCVSTVLSLIEEYRIEAMLCMPFKSGSNEVIQLNQLKGAVKLQIIPVPKFHTSCLPSCRVPHDSLNPAFLSLGVVHISWTKG
jgi:hypothetical protein